MEFGVGDDAPARFASPWPEAACHGYVFCTIKTICDVVRFNWTLKCVNWTVILVVSSFFFSLDAYIIYFKTISLKICAVVFC